MVAVGLYSVNAPGVWWRVLEDDVIWLEASQQRASGDKTFGFVAYPGSARRVDNAKYSESGEGAFDEGRSERVVEIAIVEADSENLDLSEELELDVSRRSSLLHVQICEFFRCRKPNTGSSVLPSGAKRLETVEDVSYARGEMYLRVKRRDSE